MLRNQALSSRAVSVNAPASVSPTGARSIFRAAVRACSIPRTGSTAGGGRVVIVHPESVVAIKDFRAAESVRDHRGRDASQ
jgi:hypothetical protein